MYVCIFFINKGSLFVKIEILFRDKGGTQYTKMSSIKNISLPVLLLLPSLYITAIKCGK